MVKKTVTLDLKMLPKPNAKYSTFKSKVTVFQYTD